MRRPIAVAGIDPGTTSAFALLDESGNLIDSGSGKDLSLNRLIAIITDLAEVIAVGTDKRVVPSLIEKFASNTGCAIVSPVYDLSVTEKRRVTKKFDPNNEHEMDAIASAVLALRKLSPLLKRIRRAVIKCGLEQKHFEIAKMVVCREINIEEAIKSVTPDKTQVATKITRPNKTQQKTPEKQIILRLGKEVSVLREANTRLKKMLRRSAKALARKRKVLNLETERRRDYSYVLTIKRVEAEIHALRLENATLRKFITASSDYVSIPKIKTLEWDNFGPRRRDAYKVEAVFVEEPGAFSSRSISEMEGRVSIIISPKEFELKGFMIICARELTFRDLGDSVIVRKSDLQKALDSAQLAKMIEDYQLKRRSV